MNQVTSSEQDNNEQKIVTAPRDPFARARPTDVYWIQLKPIYKGRQIAHAERLARVTLIQERAAHLELFRLRVNTDGESKTDDFNLMEVLVDHKNRRVRFGPLEHVRMQPAQRGLGGYLLAQLIEWCQRSCGDYSITPIMLHAEEVSSEESRLIREKLLLRAGFDLSYSNEERTAGRAQANRVSSLISSWNTEKVAAIQISDILNQLREQEQLNRKQQAQLSQFQRVIDNFKNNEMNQRFAIGCLIVFAIFQALMLLWVVMS
ncbi:hypothetical protein RPW65_11015 [Pseudomonas sp. NyZ704]|nr:hypothetical protein RPW65_11015 [Pseudomonas sp. NyZ704]